MHTSDRSAKLNCASREAKTELLVYVLDQVVGSSEAQIFRVQELDYCAWVRDAAHMQWRRGVVVMQDGCCTTAGAGIWGKGRVGGANLLSMSLLILSGYWSNVPCNGLSREHKSYKVFFLLVPPRKVLSMEPASTACCGLPPACSTQERGFASGPMSPLTHQVMLAPSALSKSSSM